jgi:YHS domain-containing protein
MSVVRIVLVMLAIAGSARAQSTTPPKEALDGVDPVVLLTQGKEVSGRPDLKVTRDKFTYLFATPVTKATFEQAPEKYEIQLSGACARMGSGVTGNPSDYAVVDGRIYIFGSDDCHKKFVAAPAKFLPKPAPPMPAAAAALSQGRALVERAVTAIGGAAKLDAVTTYVETSSQVQKRPTGDAAIALRTMWRFPGGIRAERTMTLADRTQTSANLVTPAGGWFIGQGHAYPQNAEGRAASAAIYNRQLVPLLRARREADFTAAALGPATEDGIAVERVRVIHASVDVTLAIEKASGVIHSVAFTGRGPDAEIGDYVIALGDYRDVAGLRLPFSERALFNGAPEPSLTRTIDAIRINTPLDPSLFEPGTGGAL